MNFKKLFWCSTVSISLLLMGCNEDGGKTSQRVEKTENQISTLERKMADLETRIKEVKTELAQTQSVLTSLGNKVIDLQKSEENRLKAQIQPQSKTTPHLARSKHSSRHR